MRDMAEGGRSMDEEGTAGYSYRLAREGEACRSSPATEESHEARSKEDPEDGNSDLARWRFRHCERGRARSASVLSDGPRQAADSLLRSKTRSCARHSTSPAQRRIPALLASRIPLTMLAAAESGL